MTTDAQGRPRVLWFTGLVVLIVLAGQSASRSTQVDHEALVQRWGISWPDLASLRVHRLLTALVVQEQPGFSLPILGLVAFSCPWYERARGAVRSAVVFVLSDFGATILSLATFRTLAAFGSARAREWAESAETGASVGAFGSLGAYAAVARGACKVTALTLGVASFAVPLLRRIRVSDIQHGLGFVFGYAVAHLLERARPAT